MLNSVVPRPIMLENNAINYIIAYYDFILLANDVIYSYPVTICYEQLMSLIVRCRKWNHILLAKVIPLLNDITTC